MLSKSRISVYICVAHFFKLCNVFLKSEWQENFRSDNCKKCVKTFSDKDYINSLVGIRLTFQKTLNESYYWRVLNAVDNERKDPYIKSYIGTSQPVLPYTT